MIQAFKIINWINEPKFADLIVYLVTGNRQNETLMQNINRRTTFSNVELHQH